MFSSAVVLTLALSALAAPLAPRQACADVTVFFARGTGELGTLGTVVGPPFRTALQSALGRQSVDFVGINYAANVAGFLAGGDARGATTMADSVTSKAASCPNTKIVMSGYSQGAQVAHLAAGKLSAGTQSRVNAVVVFGDPKKEQPFPGISTDRVKTFCAARDNICAGGARISAAHLGYGSDARAAASFVASK